MAIEKRFLIILVGLNACTVHSPENQFAAHTAVSLKPFRFIRQSAVLHVFRLRSHRKSRTIFDKDANKFLFYLIVQKGLMKDVKAVCLASSLIHLLRLLPC